MARYKHPWMHRRTRWLTLAGTLLGISFFVVVIAVPASRATIWWYLAIPLVQVLCVAAFFVRIAQARKSVAKIDGRACGNCLFSLKDLEVEGVCPECGHEYQIGNTIAKWKHDLGFNGRYEYRHWPELPKDDA